MHSECVIIYCCENLRSLNLSFCKYQEHCIGFEVDAVIEVDIVTLWLLLGVIVCQSLQFPVVHLGTVLISPFPVLIGDP